MNWKQSLLVVGSGLIYGYVFAVGPAWLKAGMAVFCLIQAWQGIQRIRSLNRAIAIGQQAWINSFSELIEEVDFNPVDREQIENAIVHFRTGNIVAGLRQLNELNFDVKKDCLYYSGSSELKCAVNPASPCETCPHFEMKSS